MHHDPIVPVASADLLRAAASASFRPERWSRSDFCDLDIVATCDGWQGCWAGVIYRKHKWKRGYLRTGAPSLAPQVRCVLVPAWPGIGRDKVDVVVAVLDAP